jgi:hypothetical protein
MAQSKNRLTCGDFGGRNAKGDPCGVATVDGPCAAHKQQVDFLVGEHMNQGAEFLTPPFERTKDKVCIVGFTHHREIAATLDRDEWEIWGLNELYRYMPPNLFDRWFEIHGREYLEKDEDGEKHVDDLKKFPIPVYMQHVHEDIPCSVKFPVDEMCDSLGSSYFTNCPAYMLAFAILMGFETIWVVGVDMAQESEYYTQRTCMEYWLGRAQGAGIDTWVPENSDLLKSVGLYGYAGDGSRLSRKLQERYDWLHEQDNQRLDLMRRLTEDYQNKRNKVLRFIYLTEGAMAELESHRQTKKIAARLEELREKHGQAKATVEALDKEFGDKNQRLRDERNQLVGSIQDCKYIMQAWLNKADSLEGGNIPSAEERAADPRLGITAPSADTESSLAAVELETVGV